MRAALARVRDTDQVGLAVGTDEVSLSRGSESVVERKVALPLRWIKGLVEVQAYQARMVRKLEVSGFEAARFLRSLPKGSATTSGWVVPSGRGLRLSQVAFALGHTHRRCRSVCTSSTTWRGTRRLCGSTPTSRTGSSVWELVLDEARFTLALSPEVSRGFSGEGQVLADLAARRWEESLPRVHASLKWSSRIEPDAVAASCLFDRDTVTAALGVLGARGLVGYDLAEGAYFHRELPFDLDKVEALQPRLLDARKLLESGGVRIERNDAVDGPGRGRRAGNRRRASRPSRARRRPLHLPVVRQAPHRPRAVQAHPRGTDHARGRGPTNDAKRARSADRRRLDRGVPHRSPGNSRSRAHEARRRRGRAAPGGRKGTSAANRSVSRCDLWCSTSFRMLSIDAPRAASFQAARAAVLATATFSQWKSVKRHGLPSNELAFRILNDRRPEWLAEFVELVCDEEDHMIDRWPLIRQLVREGFCPPPQSPRYIDRMMNSMPSDAASSKAALRDALLADPGLLEHEIWRIFETEPGRRSIQLLTTRMRARARRDDMGSRPCPSWPATARSPARGSSTPSLDGLSRDMHDMRARWFAALHDRLEPTPRRAWPREAHDTSIFWAAGTPQRSPSRSRTSRI